MDEETELEPVVLSKKDVEDILQLLAGYEGIVDSILDGLDNQAKSMGNMVFQPYKMVSFCISAKLGPDAILRYEEIKAKGRERQKQKKQEKEAQDTKEALEALLKILN